MAKERRNLQKLAPVSEPSDVQAPELDPAALQDAICEVGFARRKILLALREALERARELTGLPSKRAAHRDTPST